MYEYLERNKIMSDMSSFIVDRAPRRLDYFVFQSSVTDL